jgi:hypothetical protein
VLGPYTPAPPKARAGPSIILDVEIDGSRYHAEVDSNGILADAAVLDRARLMVAFGETFDIDGTRVAATLDGPPTFVALTIMRGADRVHAFELSA